MEKIEALIPPFKLDDVLATLRTRGVEDIAVCEVKAASDTPQHCLYRGVVYDVPVASRIKLELFVDEWQLAPILKLIEEATRTTSGGNPVTVAVLPVSERGEIAAVRARLAEARDRRMPLLPLGDRLHQIAEPVRS